MSSRFSGGFLRSSLSWCGFLHDCGCSARRSLMTERSERMSEEAPGHRNVNGALTRLGLFPDHT
ncbi:hypothetical protein JZ09_24105 [Salmonella enterica]|nr:hypothetical protein [Salmonella enterica subsp. enterica serovar Duisburg]EAM5847653.1 hypothetical protein [Salmonella enterica]EAM5857084.1 hypothetical protein [Salmonella enterica]EAS5079889.1 hypothetical protein [Salmonella enterica]EAU9597543.1 hypothetical protein [Salmonella enterica]